MASSDYNSLFASMPSKSLILRFSDGTVIENDKIVQESLELEESLCSDLNVKYGSCESSNFNIRIVNDGVSFEGLWLDVYLVVNHQGKIFVTDDDKMFVTDDGYFFEKIKRSDPLKIGRYKVWSDKPTNDRVYRDLTCYDAMKDILNTDVASWYNGLTFPKTLKQLRDSLFNYLGITQETVTLTNDSYSVKGGYTTSELSCRDVIVSICEISGTFGHINREGKFEYISIPSSDTVTLSHYQNGTGAYEDYVTAKITGIVSYAADGSVGISVGTTTNQYVVQNNLILFGDEGNASYTTALTNLLNKIKNFQYRPYSVRTYGNPMMDLGTNIVINTTNQTINSFVMNRLLSGIQGMKDEYSAVGEANLPEDVNEMKSVIKRLKGKTVSLDVDISEISSEVVLKVTNDGKIVEAALTATPSGSAFKIKADNIDFIANGKIQLSSNSLEIYSTNFQVDSSGQITAKSGTIGGLNIGSDGFYVGSGSSLTSKYFKLSTTVIEATTQASSNISRHYKLDTDYISFGRNKANGAEITVEENAYIGHYTRNSVDYGTLVLTESSGLKSITLSVEENAILCGTSNSAFYIGSNNGNIYFCKGLTSTSNLSTIHCANMYGVSSSNFNLYAPALNMRKFDNSAYTSINASAFNVQSSKLVKENIKEIEIETAKKLLDLEVVDFDYINGEKNQTGLIAEDVLNILPNIVSVPENYDEENAKKLLKKGEFAQTLAIDYSKLTPYLVKMVQILYRELEDLKNA